MTRVSYSRAILTVLALISVVVLMGETVYAKERQLAGVRLNEHAVALLELYGPPDGIVTGSAGPAFAPQAAGVGEIGMVGPGGIPGMGAGGIPGMGAGEFPEGPPGVPGVAAPGAAAPGAAAGGSTGVVPNWALPVYIDSEPGEMMWLYQRGGVTLGFLLDLDGYVQAIAVAADECSYARSAMWEPHRYIKMGDQYTRVLQRYGWADDTITYQASGLAGGAATPSVTFQSTSKTFSRDCVLRYTENGNNIDFTLHDFRVVRIHIWD